MAHADVQALVARREAGEAITEPPLPLSLIAEGYELALASVDVRPAVLSVSWDGRADAYVVGVMTSGPDDTLVAGALLSLIELVDHEPGTYAGTQQLDAGVTVGVIVTGPSTGKL